MPPYVYDILAGIGILCGAIAFIVMMCAWISGANMRTLIPDTIEGLKPEDAKRREQAANAAIWDPLWAIYDARQAERRALLESQHPEFVIARALGEDYPDFAITQRQCYRQNDVVPGRKVYWNGVGQPSYTSAPPPEEDVPWVIVYERLTHTTFKSEKLAATWLQRYTERRAAQVAYDSDGARLGSYTARDVDEDAETMRIRWNERD